VPVLAFALALSLVVFLHMVIGEMAPKNLALARAEDVALRLVRPFGWFVTALRPLILLLNAAANLLVRLVRVEPVDEHKLVHTPDELALALAESRQLGTITAQDARVLDAALGLASIDAEAAMTPRVDLHSLPDTATLPELLELAAETGHTRLPVFHEDIDHIVGLVHVKDVLIREDHELAALTVADLLRPIPAVPESRDLEQLLRDMLDAGSHAVLVVDEFGGTAPVGRAVPANHRANSEATAGSATAPRPSEHMVMPSCAPEKVTESSRRAVRARAARGSPSSAASSMRVRRAASSEISAATKPPLATSRTTPSRTARRSTGASTAASTSTASRVGRTASSVTTRRPPRRWAAAAGRAR